ncbi:MAG: 2-oxoglutarate dehydrogenase complex dihydrolipoyllysine-residue succinyltransferase [Alphaproteobacteria bacterium]|jgi:2-oxoglutarate dehydrogenase E2 component (dihydrolipoamide succinyltransferase)|nr:2-oxoglutarate dehydrogenase complex dihydrolipoyllysine-residue succinyltransferase [Alphaproteobacteria bacterium]MBP9877632.1 2-oxoglutarate dehydrogenase complex dihydrolipoyllysine-residue succinyltransferase [Alphaproteobacteria bacterium]
MAEITVPSLGESVTEATVAKWLKQQGETVAVDEPLVELETDKVTLEVNAPSAGVLSQIIVSAGENVGVGALLGKIEAAGAAAATSAKAAASPAPAPQATAAAAPSIQLPTQASSQEDQLSPTVRKMINDYNLDANSIRGTGKDGRISKEDVLNYLSKQTAKAPAAPAAMRAPSAPRQEDPREERVKMSRLRQRIAERLKEAQNTAAMLTTFNEVDMSHVMKLRNEYKDAFEKKHGVKLGFMSFFVKACLNALKEIPAVNAEIDGTDLIYKNYYDIGVAVGSPQGLVVPVVRDADKLNFAGVEKTIADLGKKARDGKLSMDDLSGGTFTISNGGIYGSLMSTPILNPPQSGILGMHKIQERPIVIDGKIEVRPMMYLALSYDHRIIDGKEAVTFLIRVKECIEDPQRLLLDI